MPNTWIALNPFVKGFKNEFIVPNRFADFENSFAKRVMEVFLSLPRLSKISPIGQDLNYKINSPYGRILLIWFGII